MREEESYAYQTGKLGSLLAYTIRVLKAATNNPDKQFLLDAIEMVEDEFDIKNDRLKFSPTLEEYIAGECWVYDCPSELVPTHMLYPAENGRAASRYEEPKLKEYLVEVPGQSHHCPTD